MDVLSLPPELIIKVFIFLAATSPPDFYSFVRKANEYGIPGVVAVLREDASRNGWLNVTFVCRSDSPHTHSHHTPDSYERSGLGETLHSTVRLCGQISMARWDHHGSNASSSEARALLSLSETTMSALSMSDLRRYLMKFYRASYIARAFWRSDIAHRQ